MEVIQKQIRLKITDNYGELVIETFEGEYPNLMSLIRDHLMLGLFGQCGGMGRCATCVVTACGITGGSEIKERNEPSTLLKYGLYESNVRLSCQLSISTDIDGAEFTILEV